LRRQDGLRWITGQLQTAHRSIPAALLPLRQATWLAADTMAGWLIWRSRSSKNLFEVI